MPFDGVLRAAHLLVGERLSSGELAVDATCGNGHDTVFLAEQVGPSGHVFGFDIQEAAIESTRRRLLERSLSEHVTLVHTGHERLIEALASRLHAHKDDVAPPQEGARALRDGLGACMFNLGYLPGSDTSVITEPETTVAALEAALALLRPGGILTVILYTGHPGGSQESAAVMRWAENIERRRADCIHYRLVNTRGNPPELLACEKRG